MFRIMNNLPKLGLRNIKTAISVVLCILVLPLFTKDPPFYACIAAVVVMQNTVSSTWKAGITRMAGTLIGAAIGLILSFAGLNNVLIIGLGIIVLIYLTNVFNIPECAGIGCVVYLAIMINNLGQDPVYYSIMRVFETLMGIIIATVVNAVVRIPGGKNKVSEGENCECNRKEQGI